MHFMLYNKGLLKILIVFLCDQYKTLSLRFLSKQRIIKVKINHVTFITWLSPSSHHLSHHPSDTFLLESFVCCWIKNSSTILCTHKLNLSFKMSTRTYKKNQFMRRRTKHCAGVSIPVPTAVGVEGDGDDLGVQDDDVIQLPHLVITSMSDVVLIYVMSDNHIIM